MRNHRVVLALSGGVDSSTLLSYYLNLGVEIYPITFEYASKHNKYERLAAEFIAKFYQLKSTNIFLPFIGDLFVSNLLKTGGEIPEGYYTDKNMSQTVVPARNVIFISIMMGIAWSVEADIIAIGVHSGDHTIYGDCRPGFISAMNAAVIQASDDKVHLEAPFLYYDKTQIIKLGLQLLTPYELTRTCYKEQEYACGKCGSCQERLEAFQNLNIIDPIKYEREI